MGCWAALFADSSEVDCAGIELALVVVLVSTRSTRGRRRLATAKTAVRARAVSNSATLAMMIIRRRRVQGWELISQTTTCDGECWPGSRRPLFSCGRSAEPVILAESGRSQTGS
jgi:hypothetical protein